MIPDNIPYTTTLSLLRKIDLMRLSLEFRLSTDGSVVVLRNRLKAYLNASAVQGPASGRKPGQAKPK